RLSGRDEQTVQLVEAYAKAQGLWRRPGLDPLFSDSLELDLGAVEASLAGPRRPQDRVALPRVSQAFDELLALQARPAGAAPRDSGPLEHDGQRYELQDGAVVIAAITSCTNTSNPSVMMAAGLLAKKAVE